MEDNTMTVNSIQEALQLDRVVKIIVGYLTKTQDLVSCAAINSQFRKEAHHVLIHRPQITLNMASVGTFLELALIDKNWLHPNICLDLNSSYFETEEDAETIFKFVSLLNASTKDVNIGPNNIFFGMGPKNYIPLDLTERGTEMRSTFISHLKELLGSLKFIESLTIHFPYCTYMSIGMESLHCISQGVSFPYLRSLTIETKEYDQLPEKALYDWLITASPKLESINLINPWLLESFTQSLLSNTEGRIDGIKKLSTNGGMLSCLLRPMDVLGQMVRLESFGCEVIPRHKRISDLEEILQTLSNRLTHLSLTFRKVSNYYPSPITFPLMSMLEVLELRILMTKYNDGDYPPLTLCGTPNLKSIKFVVQNENGDMCEEIVGKLVRTLSEFFGSVKGIPQKLKHIELLTITGDVKVMIHTT